MKVSKPIRAHLIVPSLIFKSLILKSTLPSESGHRKVPREPQITSPSLATWLSFSSPKALGAPRAWGYRQQKRGIPGESLAVITNGSFLPSRLPLSLL